MSGLARVSAVGLTGIKGFRVIVEGGVGRQLPGMHIVGLPDAALNESKQRVRHAAAANGMNLNERFVLINLQPADMPKHGASFDLAIALAALSALSHVPKDRLHDVAHIGELGLDGQLKRPRGLLASVQAAKELGFKTVIVPAECQLEALLVRGIKVIAADSLLGAVNWHAGKKGGWFEATPVKKKLKDQEALLTQKVSTFAQIVGQQEAIEALQVAAVGRHHMHMEGPPGSGKTMLASALPEILPPILSEQAIAINSLKGLNDAALVTKLQTVPPFESPHHTASAASIIGTAQGGWIKPGAVSLASYGILFLDEAQEFSSAILDTLRQPLETGVVQIHRAYIKAELPAEIQLILASNPCPCGFYGSIKTVQNCSCTPHQIRRYKNKISGPLLDRIDIRLRVDRVSKMLDLESKTNPLKTFETRQRVIGARKVAAERFRGESWRLNAEVPGHALRAKKYFPGRKATEVIDRALELGTITLRGYDKILRLAWSVADLKGATVPGREEIGKALMLREGERF